MNEKQYKEFGAIVQQCDSGQYNTINVASQVRSDALRAAWEERGELRELLRKAVILFECDDECCDPATDAWGWLQNARTVLEGALCNDS
jgi:hypothetical protein